MNRRSFFSFLPALPLPLLVLPGAQTGEWLSTCHRAPIRNIHTSWQRKVPETVHHYDRSSGYCTVCNEYVSFADPRRKGTTEPVEEWRLKLDKIPGEYREWSKEKGHYDSRDGLSIMGSRWNPVTGRMS